jgi:hypothetical protein
MAGGGAPERAISLLTRTHPTALRLLLAPALAALMASLVACGDDESSDSADTSESELSCVEEFASDAPTEFGSLANLSHDPKSEVLAGSYTGAEFTAETYDESTTGDGSEITVGPGACVITEVGTSVDAVLYLFVVGSDGSWHRLLESDPKVPLVPDPEASMDDIEAVAIEQLGG